MWRISEDISLARMRMNIEKHLQSLPLFRNLLRKVLFHEGSYVLDFSQPGLGFGVVISKEASVHIFALGVASVVARNDTIRIDHGQNPKLDLFSDFEGLYVSR